MATDRPMTGLFYDMLANCSSTRDQFLFRFNSFREEEQGSRSFKGFRGTKQRHSQKNAAQKKNHYGINLI